ncbi:MAG TPA: RluA family pseudouridine synthase [Patescibacteria group bacterium]|nr:RluA family pseudouridine synthase [Patescibacteria group bacterium]
MNIRVIFEDDEILVIDKPAGITVNRAETTRHETTVQDWAEETLKIKYQRSNLKYGDEGWTPEIDFSQRGGIVHRLDKETSGVLVLAKTPQVFVELLRQFREREVKKEYQALAHGKLQPEVGEINVPVGRLPWNRKQFGIVPGGRESKTLYKVLAYYQEQKKKEIFSFVELYPHSGRTHQIRVHLKYIGHPIFADFLYAGRKTARDDRKVLERVFLHAAKLSFTHPTKKESVTFSSPLPVELISVLDGLLKLS